MQTIYLLIWGGGDDPESPSLAAFESHQSAIAHAREYLESIETDADDIARICSTLTHLGERAEAAGSPDSFMEVLLIPLQP